MGREGTQVDGATALMRDVHLTSSYSGCIGEINRAALITPRTREAEL